MDIAILAKEVVEHPRTREHLRSHSIKMQVKPKAERDIMHVLTNFTREIVTLVTFDLEQEISSLKAGGKSSDWRVKWERSVYRLVEDTKVKHLQNAYMQLLAHRSITPNLAADCLDTLAPTVATLTGLIKADVSTREYYK